METNKIIILLFFVFYCTTAFPLDNSNEATTPRNEDNGSVWTSWYMISINVLVPITMIISVACCCCCRSSKTKNQSTKAATTNRDENDQEKGIKMEHREQMIKSGKTKNFDLQTHCEGY